MSPRRLLVVLSGVLVLLLIVGFGLYPLVLNQAKDFPDDISRTYRSVSTSDAYFQPDAAAACGDGADAGGNHRTGDLSIEETMATSPGPKKTSVNIHGTWALTSPSGPVVDVDDHVTVSKESTFPVADPTAETTLTVAWPAWCGYSGGASPAVSPAAPGGSVHSGPETQQGLRYAFPFITDPRSYSFYEPLTHGYQTLDFVDRRDIPRMDPSSHENGDTLRVFEFRGSDYLAEVATEQPAPDGALRAFAAINRTLFVEPRTGVIVNKTARIRIGYAHSADEARALFADADAQDRTKPHPTASKVVLSGDFAWDQATQAAQQNVAIPVLDRLQWARLVAWIAKMGALILVVVGGLIVRRRAAETRAES